LIDEFLILRETSFLRMAMGDVEGFGDMAREFLSEIRNGSEGWQGAWNKGDHTAVALEIHRSRGGASLFGFERLHAFFAACERKLISGTFEFEPALMESELEKAERALAAFVDPG
jgi:HPt (histidine-containing phosphotransfer) domain-containing protein